MLRQRLLRIGIVIPFILISLAACTTKHNSNENAKEPIEEVKTKKSGRLTTPLTNTIHHTFSDKSHPDTFTISLTGDSIVSGTVTFEIKNYKDELLYRDSFPATDLLGDYDIQDMTEQADTIAAAINNFFQGAFQKPAVKSRDPEPDDPQEQELWKEIKSDSSSVGFIYSHGYEGTYSVAYSKKRNKVVMYASYD